MIDLKSKTLLTITSIILSSNLLANNTQNLNTVTVSAQKSIEDVQKIPMSINVFNAQTLKNNIITKLDDIALYTPGLLLFNTGEEGLITPSIRGISGNISSFSTPVSLYLDGVPVMSSFGYTNALLDVERIEVLKGPQGTLYGNNSEVGVINIISKKPNNKSKAKLSVIIANKGKKEYQANLSFPIIKDKFYVSLALKHEEKDGFIKNTNSYQKENNKEGDFQKINLRFTPLDNLDISFVVSNSKRNDGSLDWAKAGQENNVEVSSNLIGYSKPKERNYSLKVDYDINNTSKFTSITAKRNYKEKAALDLDLSATNMAHIYRDYEFDTFSQEFKLEKNFKNTKLLAGVYFSKEKDDIYFKRVTMMAPLGMSSLQYLNSKTYSIYSNVTTRINDKFSISAGLRYDYEKKDLILASSTIKLEKDFKNISPKLSFLYDFNDESMMYFTLAQGYKSGGFNAFVSLQDEKKFTEEELTSYELGYKTYLFNNSVIFNSSLYYMNINDMQVELRDGSNNPYTTNAAKAKSQGLELEVQAFVSDDITLFANGALNKTIFKEYKNNSNDYSGNTNPFAPKYNFNLGVLYENVSGYFTKVDLAGYGKTYFDPANKYFQKAYEVVNVKVGYSSKNYEIYFYGKNVFDQKHDATNVYLNGTVSVYNDDKEFGVQLAYKF